MSGNYRLRIAADGRYPIVQPINMVNQGKPIPSAVRLQSDAAPDKKTLPKYDAYLLGK